MKLGQLQLESSVEDQVYLYERGLVRTTSGKLSGSSINPRS
jgi:hypothetical protein